MQINKEKKDLLILSLFIILISCSFLIFFDFIPFGHDGRFHLSRISSLRDAIIIGYDFPIKIYPNYFNGIGYANGIFYPDLYLYIPAYLATLGINVITTYKITLVICSIATLYFMYICSKEITNSHKAGIISSFIYTLSGYRLYNMFDRAALGELLAMCFIPLAIYGLFHILYRNKEKWHYFVIGFSSILLSHIISSVLFILFLISFCIVSFSHIIRDYSRLRILFASCCLVVLLVAYFYFPMIEQLVSDRFILNTQTINNDLSESTFPLYKLFIDFPLHMIPKLNISGISSIGILSFISIIIYLYHLKHYKQNNSTIFKLFCLAIFFTLPTWTLFPWKYILNIIPWFSAIQFSWRFFVISVFLFSIVSGYIFQCYFDNKTIKRILLTLYSCIAVANIAPSYILELYCLHIGKPILFDKYYIGNGEYLPFEACKENLWNSSLVPECNNKQIIINHRWEKDTYIIEYDNNNIDTSYIQLPLLYYKGYNAESQKSINYILHKNTNGLIQFNLPFEKDRIYIKYEGTDLQKTCNKISLLTCALFFIFVFLKNTKTKK